MSSSKELQFIDTIEDEEVKDFLKNYLKENSLKIVKKRQNQSKINSGKYERCCATTKRNEQCKRKKGQNVPVNLCLFHYKRPGSYNIDMEIDEEEPEQAPEKNIQEDFFDSLCKKINSLEI